MITNRLSALMGERHIKATRIASDTGIARSTLTALTSGSSKMIQFETINTLCQYLRVEPKDFFEYVPIDISFDVETTSISAFFNMDPDTLNWSQGIEKYTADVFAKFLSRNNIIKTIELSATLEDPSIVHGGENYILSGAESVTINVDDTKDEQLDTFWHEHKLESFINVLETDLENAVQEEVVSAANKDTQSGVFDSWNVSAAIPVMPF
ncbi:helix-turn-helix domain-containing protein [Secundilactobacillus yichangensis]|uniref:helix-turn-helix domain-containing protein n=1 Tax=Secundilactobacillus yichangensis TaxID=2799580 RepID=UPI001940C9FF|nr:helix-turn-helix transcriptional regulator [Secundilactobacillus yichangensis]